MSPTLKALRHYMLARRDARATRREREPLRETTSEKPRGSSACLQLRPITTTTPRQVRLIPICSVCYDCTICLMGFDQRPEPASISCLQILGASGEWGFGAGCKLRIYYPRQCESGISFNRLMSVDSCAIYRAMPKRLRARCSINRAFGFLARKNQVRFLLQGPTRILSEQRMRGCRLHG